MKSDGATYGDYAAGYGYAVAGRLTEYQSPFAYDPAEAGDPGAGRPVQAMTVDEAGNVTARDTVVDAVLREQQTATFTDDRLEVQSTEFFDAAGASQGTASIEVGYGRLGDETARTTEAADGTVTDRATSTGPARHVTDVDQSGGDDRDVDYTYTATGRLLARVETDPAAGTTAADLHFNNAATGTLAEITDGNGHTRAAYLSTPDGHQWGQQRWPTAADGSADEAAAPTWVWLADDARGNVATEVGTDGTVLAQAAYDPYGTDEQSGSEGDPAALLGFQSSPTDEVTGATLVGPRQYDPQTGRFTTADHHTAAALDLELATDPLTGNPYIYAGANPVTYHDDGHRVTEGTTQGSSPSPPRTAGRASPSDEFTIHGDPLFFHGCSPRSRMCGPGHYPTEGKTLSDALSRAMRQIGEEYSNIACPETPPLPANTADQIALFLDSFSCAADGVAAGITGFTLFNGVPADELLGLPAAAGVQATGVISEGGKAVVGGFWGSNLSQRKWARNTGLQALGTEALLSMITGGLSESAKLVEQTGGTVPTWYDRTVDAVPDAIDLIVP